MTQHFKTVKSRLLLSRYLSSQTFKPELSGKLGVSPEFTHRGTVASIVNSLKQCTKSRDMAGGKRIHSQVNNSGLRDIFIDSTLVDMYAKCGSMVLSRSVFDSMPQRNAVSWNCLIHGYVENGHPELALQLFDTMQTLETGCAPTCRTYAAALNACAHLGSRRDVQSLEWLEKGKAVYMLALKNKCCDRFVKTMAVNMYAKCGCMAEARRLFDSMSQRTVVSWTALIQGYVENGESRIGLELFDRMEEDDQCQPNARTFLAALLACTALLSSEKTKWLLEKAETIYLRAVKSGCCDIFVENTLVSLYASCGELAQARSVFDKMLKHNVVTWNALVQGFVDNGKSEMALDLFECMQAEDGCVPDARTFVAAIRACASLAFEEDVKPGECSRWLHKGRSIHSRSVKSRCSNIFVENALVDMYSKFRSMVDSQRVFDGMTRRDLVSWNSLIRGYVHNGENEVVLDLVSRMKTSGIRPDSGTYVAGLMACGNLVAAEAGVEFHAEIKAYGLEHDLSVATCLVEFYGRCGNMKVAKQVFDSISHKDVWAWNALLSGYSLQGNISEVFQSFHVMTGRDLIHPNAATFTHLLCACSHAGLVEQGKEYLQVMERLYGIKPDVVHYTCVIDALGRADRVEEAMEFVKRMPVRPNAATWTSVLAACSKWNDVDLGPVAYRALLASADKPTA